MLAPGRMTKQKLSSGETIPSGSVHAITSPPPKCLNIKRTFNINNNPAQLLVLLSATRESNANILFPPPVLVIFQLVAVSIPFPPGTSIA